MKAKQRDGCFAGKGHIQESRFSDNARTVAVKESAGTVAGLAAARLWAGPHFRLRHTVPREAFCARLPRDSQRMVLLDDFQPLHIDFGPFKHLLVHFADETHPGLRGDGRAEKIFMIYFHKNSA